MGGQRRGGIVGERGNQSQGTSEGGVGEMLAPAVQLVLSGSGGWAAANWIAGSCRWAAINDEQSRLQQGGFPLWETEIDTETWEASFSIRLGVAWRVK